MDVEGAVVVVRIEVDEEDDDGGVVVVVADVVVEGVEEDVIEDILASVEVIGSLLLFGGAILL